MTDTNPRDLIQNMAEELDTWLMAHHHGGVPPEIQHAATLVAEARDYLAQPEPKWPTDEEIEQFADELRLIKNPARVRVVCDDAGFVKEHAYDECGFRIHDEVGFARAVLARWGK